MKTALEWKNYYSTADFKEKYIYEGDDLGVLCTTEGTSFRLWSPSAESVTLNLYERGDGGEPFRSVPMDKEDRGVWSWQCGEELHGVYYDYILEIDGETMRSADPYAKACGLNGGRSMAVNLRRTDPEGWEVIDKKTEALMPEEIGGGAFQDGVYAFNTLGISACTIMENGYSNSYRYWPSTLTRNPTLMKLEVNEWLGADTLAEYVIANDMVAKSTQAVNMITPISDELEMVVSQIGEIVKKYSWQMIYAKDEAEFETLWLTMQTEAEGLGMAQVVEYYESEWAKALEIVKDYE